MSITRELIRTRLIETLTSPTGAGSNLENPVLHRDAGTYIELAGGDHSLDIDHLTNDVEQIYKELKERDLV